MSTNVKKTNTDKLNILTSRFFFTIVQYSTHRTTPVMNSPIYRQIREFSEVSREFDGRGQRFFISARSMDHASGRRPSSCPCPRSPGPRKI